MDPRDLVTLTALMERTTGSPEIKIGLIDGPVVTQLLTWGVNISAKFLEITVPRALRPTAPRACTEPL
jgi:hypothetical protein